MRTARSALLVALAALLLALAGCTAPEDGEPLFEQGGEGAGPAEPVESLPPSVGPANVTVHVVDVGQGDGIVVHLPGFTAVYDTGRWHGESVEAVRDHLQAEGADPDALVVSHPDADHAGGCALLLETFGFEQIYHPGLAKDTRTWRECEQAMRAEDAPVHTDEDLAIGELLDWTSPARVQVLHVDGEARDANAGSLALAVDAGEVEIALTGDLPCEAEEQVLGRGMLPDAEIVQVGHHGSSTSTCEPWLEALEPEAGFLSVGADNPYGHPHREVLDRLAEHGVDVYRTDEHGSLAIETNGTAWTIETGTEAPGSTDDAREEATNASSPVQIAAIRADAEGDDHGNLNDEWVRIANAGNDTVELGGWTLADEAGHTYTFPADATLAPDANVTVHTGEGNDTAGHRYWGRDQAVWNNAGDQATLRDDGGALVDEESY